MQILCPGDPRTQRFRALTRGYEASPHYADDAFPQQYAQRHKEEMLHARSDILQEDHAFRDDPYFILYLKAVAPHLLQWATWRSRALQMAERLDAGDAPPIPKQALTPEERQEKIERFRESLVQRERTKIGDETAMAFVALELIDALKDLEKAKIKEIAARDDLTDEEKDERIQNIKAMTQQRFNTLMEGTAHAENHQHTDTPPPAVILGQP